MGSLFAAVLSVVSAVGPAAAAAQAVGVVAVALVVPKHAASLSVAIVRSARMKVRHGCKKESSSSNEQESGNGRVKEHLISERVLFGQVDSTPDQLVPQNSEFRCRPAKRRAFEQAKRPTHGQVRTSSDALGLL